MKSEWRVTSNIFGEKKVYAVYRLKNVDEVDHGGNRERASEWLESRAEAEQIAREMNQQESEK